MKWMSHWTLNIKTALDCTLHHVVSDFIVRRWLHYARLSSSSTVAKVRSPVHGWRIKYYRSSVCLSVTCIMVSVLQSSAVKQQVFDTDISFLLLHVQHSCVLLLSSTLHTIVHSSSNICILLFHRVRPTNFFRHLILDSDRKICNKMAYKMLKNPNQKNPNRTGRKNRSWHSTKCLVRLMSCSCSIHCTFVIVF